MHAIPTDGVSFRSRPEPVTDQGQIDEKNSNFEADDLF